MTRVWVSYNLENSMESFHRQCAIAHDGEISKLPLSATSYLIPQNITRLCQLNSSDIFIALYSCYAAQTVNLLTLKVNLICTLAFSDRENVQTIRTLVFTGIGQRS